MFCCPRNAGADGPRRSPPASLVRARKTNEASHRRTRAPHAIAPNGSDCCGRPGGLTREAAPPVLAPRGAAPDRSSRRLAEPTDRTREVSDAAAAYWWLGPPPAAMAAGRRRTAIRGHTDGRRCGSWRGTRASVGARRGGDRASASWWFPPRVRAGWAHRGGSGRLRLLRHPRSVRTTICVHGAGTQNAGPLALPAPASDDAEP
jgi:hypothetical protein